MAFSDFKVLADVANKYNVLIYEKDSFFENVLPFSLSPSFIANMRFGLRLRKTNASEYFLCESLIYPLFSEVLQQNPKTNFWSHEYTLTASPELTGVPDYLISIKVEHENFEQLRLPFVAVGDAKKDDFAGGWAQTLAEMIACQQLNKTAQVPIWGIVTTGTIWEFGCLKGNIFTQDLYSYSIGTNTEKIAGILDFILKEGVRCAEAVEADI
jgi:hypothetical protein